MSYREIAELDRTAHQNDKALAASPEGASISLAALVRSQPDSASYQGDLGRSWNYLGVIHDDARNHDGAIRAFQNAVRRASKRPSRKTDSADLYRWYLANHLENLGEQYFDLGRPAEGLPYYNEALKIRRELSQANPEKRQYCPRPRQRLVASGNIERHLGEADQRTAVVRGGATRSGRASEVGARGSANSRFSLPSCSSRGRSAGRPGAARTRPGSCSSKRPPGSGRRQAAWRRPRT